MDATMEYAKFHSPELLRSVQGELIGLLEQFSDNSTTSKDSDFGVTHPPSPTPAPGAMPIPVPCTILKWSLVESSSRN